MTPRPHPLVLALTLACTPSTADRPVADPEPAAPSHATATAREPDQEPTFDAPPSPEVLAWIADCSHVEMAGDPDDEYSPIQPECEALEFDQQCTSDPSGCWDEARGCEHACVQPCTRCQTDCASTCDACKADCPAGSQGCARACAEARATCRGECMATKSSCLTGCGTQESACGEAFEAKKAERCPQCDAIEECFAGNDEATCQARIPGADPLCFQWCDPF